MKFQHKCKSKSVCFLEVVMTTCGNITDPLFSLALSTILVFHSKNNCLKFNAAMAPLQQKLDGEQ